MTETGAVSTRRSRLPRRPLWQPGFRARVLGFAALLLIGAMAVGLLAQRAVLLQRLDTNVTSLLDQERAEVETLATGTNPATGEPFGTDVAAIFDTFLDRNIPGRDEAFLTFVDGRPYRTSSSPRGLDALAEVTDRWARLAEGDAGTIDTEAGAVRFLAVPLAQAGTAHGVFVAVNFVEPERRSIDDHLRVQGLVVAVVVTVALGVAWITAGRLLKPLRSVTETARTINETGLDQRIAVDSDDEVGMMAATFNQMLDRLEDAFETQRAFIDDAGHELRTPITVIMGQLELMGDDPDERAATLAVVNEELDRMSRIVEDLLLLAKSEQPNFIQVEEVEVSDFTTELAVKARSLGDRGWIIDESASGTVMLDPQRITQAVLNLARNAVEHTGIGTEVGIGSAIEDDHLVIWIRDQGPGIPAEDQPRLFDRFARGSADKRRSDGAGLGLAIVKAVSEAHGGRVTLRSRPGRGARFQIHIPDATAVRFDLTDPDLAAVAPGDGTTTEHRPNRRT